MSNIAHTGLDIVGLVPGLGEVADGANAAYYAYEGDYVNAAISTAAMVPFAGDFVTGGKYVSKIGVTVIGEGMARVESVAANIPGARILSDMPKFTGTAEEITSQMMQYNRQWILDEMRTGQTILDIGLDASRSTPSIFYQMEKNMLRNYQTLNLNTVNVQKW